MAISDVIKFGGTADDLVWKYSGEEFNATSQLIVDETHQALLVVNGQAADLFGAGRHTLSVPNIPFPPLSIRKERKRAEHSDEFYA